MERPLIFISYSRANEADKNQLLKHLSVLDTADVWSDARIGPGQNWSGEIDAALAHAQIGILLITPEFLGSTFIRETEVRALLEARASQGLTIFPIIARDCAWKSVAWLKELQVRPRDGKPIWRSGGSSQQRLAEITREVGEVLAKTVKDRHDRLLSRHFQTPLPALPEQFVTRTDILDHLKALLLGTGDSPKVGLQGMGGCGKTIIAATIARDSDIRERFSDGVIWLTVGQHADLLSLLGVLVHTLTDAPPPFTDEEDGRQVAAGLLSGRRVLLVLDDVWTKDQARVMDVSSTRTGLLVTTRDLAVLNRLNATAVEVSEFSEEQALDLLARWSGRKGKAPPAVAAAIAKACGNLPLALAMVGALARQPGRTWEDALEMLGDADLAGFETDFPNYPYPTLLAAIDVGVRDLSPDERERYLDLAAFGRRWVPTATLHMLWGKRSKTLVSLFVSRSLSTLDDSEMRLRIHDLQADYLRVRAGSIGDIHRRLIDAYRHHVEEGDFANADRRMDDGYFFQQLPSHLDAAGWSDELKRLLFDFRWLSAKLAASDVNALIADYTLVPGGASLLVKKALRLAASALARDASQLANQLLSRLRTGYPEVERLLAASRAWGEGATWLRPTRPGLIPAGGCLQQTLVGNAGGVRRLVSLGNGLIEAYCGDGMVRTWDIESGTIVETVPYKQPDEEAEPVSDELRDALRDGDSSYRVWTRLGEQRVVGLGKRPRHSGTLRIEMRDIRTATLEKEFEGECPVSHSVTAILALDEHQIVTGASEHAICLWNLTDRTLVRMFEAHKEAVTQLARLDEHRFASGSDDETVCIWDVSPQALAVTSSRHEHSIMALEATRRGVVSSSYDDRVLLWQPEGEDAPYPLVTENAGWVRPLVALREDLIAGGSVRGVLRIWKLDPPRLFFELRVNAQMITRIGEEHFVVAGSDGNVHVWNLRLGRWVQMLTGHTDRVNGLEPTGTRFLATASGDGSIRIWDVEAGDEVRVLQENAASWIAVADDRYVVFSSKKGLCAWEWTTGETFVLSQTSVDAYSMKSKAHYVAGVTYAGVLLVFDVRERSCVAEIGPDVHNFKDDKFVWLDAAHIVTGSEDHGVRVWNVASGHCVASCFGDGSITVLAVVPELNMIVAGDGTGSVQTLAFQPRRNPLISATL